MRDFTDSIKFSVVRDNLEKNNGRISTWKRNVLQM